MVPMQKKSDNSVISSEKMSPIFSLDATGKCTRKLSRICLGLYSDCLITVTIFDSPKEETHDGFGKATAKMADIVSMSSANAKA